MISNNYVTMANEWCGVSYVSSDPYYKYLQDLGITESTSSHGNGENEMRKNTEKENLKNNSNEETRTEDSTTKKQNELLNSFFGIKRIIESGPCTIVFWEDGTKTVVRCSENDIYDEYNAFCAALAIKLYGNNTRLKKVIRNAYKKVK